MELISGEWGKAKVFYLPFITYGATDYLAGITLATGDVTISKDGGAFVNIETLPTIIGKWMFITLSPTEMQAGTIAFQVIDQTATKLFEDTGAILSTNISELFLKQLILIESQRGSHSGEGEMIFWDPGNATGKASDSNSGLAYHEPKLTYNYNGANGVHDLLVDNDHQIIKGISGPGGGPTTVNEYIHVDLSYSFLRCDGRDWLFKAIHNEPSAILLSAEGIELSGCRVETKETGSQDAVIISGPGFVKIISVHVDLSRGSGILISNSSNNLLENFLIQDAALGGSGHAVRILGDALETTRNLIGSGRIFSNGNGGQTDGIRLDGEFCIHNFIHGGEKNLIIHDNTGWGINEVNDADETIIVGPTVHTGHNTLGQINLTGSVSTKENTEQWATATALAAIDTKIDAIPTERVNVVGGGGTSTPAYAEEGESSTIIRGDTVNIGRYASGDRTANRLFFAASLSYGDASHVVDEIECNVGDYDTVEDRTSYLISFVKASTNSVTPGTYKGETVIRDADGVSNEVTTDHFDFIVSGRVID